ncbi:MAG TPA: sterol desaturase family protein [Myxococcaceae bacterium]|jgi:sterol desaturase/sphingolipid hydroxylase (fatty acid hydroxylase superfamily)
MLETVAGALVFLAISAGLLGPLERFFPHAGVKRSASASAVCAALFVLNTVLMRVVGDPLLGWLESLRAEAATPSVWRIAAAFVLSDLFGYAAHRALHRVPVLWRFHRIHHEATELRWLDAWRQHPVDFVIQGLAVGIPGALLGASLTDLISVVLLRKLWTSFLHADVRARFGLLEWVVATPAFHRVHHSADPAEYDRNFAGTFPLWDMLFGTASIRRARA